MFVTKARHRSGYNRNDEQMAAGFYMYWFSVYKDHWIHHEKPADYEELDGKDQLYTNIYATVRYVTLTQLGHWMMGHARVGGVSLSASGSLGSDGLPNSKGERDIMLLTGSFKKMRVWLDTYFEVVPADVHAAWGKDTGHNTCNSLDVRNYGNDLFKRMYTKRDKFCSNPRYIIKDKPWSSPQPLVPSQPVSLTI